MRVALRTNPDSKQLILVFLGSSLPRVRSTSSGLPPPAAILLQRILPLAAREIICALLTAAPFRVCSKSHAAASVNEMSPPAKTQRVSSVQSRGLQQCDGLTALGERLPDVSNLAERLKRVAANTLLAFLSDGHCPQSSERQIVSLCLRCSRRGATSIAFMATLLAMPAVAQVRSSHKCAGCTP